MKESEELDIKMFILDLVYRHKDINSRIPDDIVAEAQHYFNWLVNK